MKSQVIALAAFFWSTRGAIAYLLVPPPGWMAQLPVVARTVGSSRPSWQLPSASVDDEDERDYSLVRRRRRGRREYADDMDDAYLDQRETQESSRRGSDYYDEEEEDEDWDSDWDSEDEEEYDLLGNELIPNPLLDSMDPDGAAERFPELAKDPRFWFDMVVFVTFLDFLSTVGPQDPFPDVPWV